MNWLKFFKNSVVKRIFLQNKSGNNKVDDDKLPVFLIKLWNIVEDPNLQSIVHWDDSGASFHISDPYLFGRNVLPHFFKHNNMNSMVRQLNMCKFPRKNGKKFIKKLNFLKFFTKI